MATGGVNVQDDRGPQNLSDLMAALLLSDKLADVHFNCTDKDGNTERIPGHRLVVCAWSEVWETMLYGSLPEERDITIEDISAEVFKQFLSFLYTDKFHPTTDLVPQLLYCAEKYMIKSLKEKCLQWIEEHANEVLMSEEFLSLEEGLVGLILGRDGLNCEEEVVFRATVKWSDKECQRQGLPITLENQRQVCGGLVPYIRFPTISLHVLRILLRQ